MSKTDACFKFLPTNYKIGLFTLQMKKENNYNCDKRFLQQIIKYTDGNTVLTANAVLTFIYITFIKDKAH